MRTGSERWPYFVSLAREVELWRRVLDLLDTENSSVRAATLEVFEEMESELIAKPEHAVITSFDNEDEKSHLVHYHVAEIERRAQEIGLEIATASAEIAQQALAIAIRLKSVPRNLTWAICPTSFDIIVDPRVAALDVAKCAIQMSRDELMGLAEGKLPTRAKSLHGSRLVEFLKDLARELLDCGDECAARELLATATRNPGIAKRAMDDCDLPAPIRFFCRLAVKFR